MNSKDGFQWTEQGGLKQGVPTIGKIQPKSNLSSTNHIFDVIIVGAGYAALTAARDCTTSGLKVLLVEARDRIGGRSWSSNIDGYPFEMGGTWVNWGQSHVWREISRYDMRKELEISQDYSHGVNEFSLMVSGKTSSWTHDEEDAVMESAIKKFVNVDRQYGRLVMPFPHDEGHNPAVLPYDRLSAADRLSQIEDTLSAQEHACLKGFILLCSGSTLDTMSFYEFLHWWALCGYTYSGCIEYLIKYKFRGGQSSFAINFWNEATSTNNLSYSFDCPIATVEDDGRIVVATSEDGRQFRAAKMICTIPLNVLHTIQFSPPLSAEKQQALNIGHLNQCVKVHAEVTNKDLRSWSAIDASSKLLYALGDGTTPAGNTHIVAFGANETHLDPENDIVATTQILKDLVDMDIKRLVFHNWSEDKYAKGAWFFPGKEFITVYSEALRARHGNVFFASSDWAVGWRSFIDGAIEEGARGAMDVIRELRIVRHSL
ncbi:probable monoamine oxidase N [Rhynchosporium secalis]|uniref:Amine oxidase n=1 Tax=Rhynchosporium secalis TaxID=38038 RepID=A0A1E1LWH6_RHYSE|nr:probable monoamine oxidase N [Rhynchosporium secalis]